MPKMKEKVACMQLCRQKFMIQGMKRLVDNAANASLLIFCVSVVFHEHSRFKGQQDKREAISITPLYHFYSLHRHLDISWVITAESSPLHLASSRTQTGNLWSKRKSLTTKLRLVLYYLKPCSIFPILTIGSAVYHDFFKSALIFR